MATDETNERKGFSGFKFQLGQLVRQRNEDGGDAFIVIQRILVQNQHGGTGRQYVLSAGYQRAFKALEIELETVEGEDG